MGEPAVSGTIGPIEHIEGNLVCLKDFDKRLPFNERMAAQQAADHTASLSKLMTELAFEVQNLNRMGALNGHADGAEAVIGQVAASINSASESLRNWSESEGSYHPCSSAKNSV